MEEVKLQNHLCLRRQSVPEAVYLIVFPRAPQFGSSFKMHFNFVLHSPWLAFTLIGISNTVWSINEIHVDLQEDIPTNGHWEIDCPGGYQELVSAYNCEYYGGVNIPEEELHGEKGFWTNCDDYRCVIKYHIQPEDVSFAARFYQTDDDLTGISINDGLSWEFIRGEGWIDIKRNLDVKTNVHIQLEHLESGVFSVLDRIAINAELSPPPETSTEYTDSTIFPTSTGIQTDSEPTSTEPEISTTSDTYSSTPSSTLETTSKTTPIETTPGVTTMDTTERTTTGQVSSSTVGDPSTIHIDVQEDIPTNGHWEIDCPGGYQELVSAYNCDQYGGVDIPVDELHGEKGFWTNCEEYRCVIKYHIQPENISFAARFYQSDDELTGISFDDGLSWKFIGGEGWVEIKENLDVKTKVHIQMEHVSSTWFSVLDKIAINAELPPRPGTSDREPH